jgi:hypothetical protein
MTNEETKTEEISEVQKSDATQVVADPSALSIIASLVKSQESRMDSFEKKFDGLAELLKEANKNPVDKGDEVENQPKAADSKDVGDKVTVGNVIAPSPKDQASIIAPADKESKTDVEGLKMENKADDADEKKDEKKEEVEKMDDDKDDKKDEKEDVKKSDDSVYEIVKTVRPAIYQREAAPTVPTGYQILKAIEGGFNGETSSAEEALTIAYNKLESGEFGNGFPTGAY